MQRRCRGGLIVVSDTTDTVELYDEASGRWSTLSHETTEKVQGFSLVSIPTK